MRKHERSKCEIRPYFMRASALCYKTLAYLLIYFVRNKILQPCNLAWRMTNQFLRLMCRRS